MGRLLLVLLIVIGFVVVVAAIDEGGVTIEQSSTKSVAVLDAITSSGDFNETGTLVFYPNNIGPVPYLFYQDQKGITVARALTFPDVAPSNFSSWTGAHVSVTGSLDNEHVVVSRITYISAP